VTARQDRLDAFEVGKPLCEVWHHSPTHRYHLALTRVAVIADDELSGGRGDVVIRRGFQGDVREVADAEGVNKLLFI
jgi:hypothetical protein